jgi:hypothetical protein
MDLPAIGTNPKQSRSGSTTQQAKDLPVLSITRRTFRKVGAYGPHALGGQSDTLGRTVRKRQQNLQYHTLNNGLPRLVLGRSVSNWCHVDIPRSPGGQSGPHADDPVPLHGQSDKPLAAKLSHLERSTRELARTGRTRDEHRPRGQSVAYRRIVHQARTEQPELQTAKSTSPTHPWISQTAYALDERFGGDVKHP